MRGFFMIFSERTMGKSAVILLAAGRGSRFGGPKQLAPVDSRSTCLAEVTLKDAADAGFAGAVLVVRREHLEQWNEKVWPIPVALAVQEEPLGTADALSVGMELAAQLCYTSWAVANADDYYGSIWPFAFSCAQRGEHAALAFPLDRVTSPHGPVNRAILESDARGALARLSEREGLYPADAERLGNPSVSMNAWVFAASVREWWPQAPGGDGEFGIPAGILVGLERGVRIAVHRVGQRWLGLTYAADLESVQSYFNDSKQQSL